MPSPLHVLARRRNPAEADHLIASRPRDWIPSWQFALPDKLDVADPPRLYCEGGYLAGLVAAELEGHPSDGERVPERRLERFPRQIPASQLQLVPSTAIEYLTSSSSL